MADKTNLLLIILDGATQRRLPLQGPRSELCPTIRNLAEQGMWCENFFSHGNPTEFSMASIFSSSLPLDSGGYQHGMSTRSGNLLRHLKKHGYSTLLSTNSYVLDTLYGYADGADAILSLYDLELIWRCMRRTFLWHILRQRERIGEAAFQTQVCAVVDRFYRFMLDYCARHAHPPAFLKIPRSRLLQYDFARMHALMDVEYKKFCDHPVSYIDTHLDEFMTIGLEQFLKIEPLQRRMVKKFAPFDRKRIAGTDMTLRTYDKQVSLGTSLTATRQWIESILDRPFAAAIHTVDIHDDVYSAGEYVMIPPASYGRLRHLSPDDWEGRKHDMALHHVDRMLDAFLSSLPGDVRARTVVAITSDHGAPSYRGQHALSSSSGTGSFHDEYLHIPFIINGPGVPKATYQALASTINVAPTICQALGIQPDPGFRGRSLFDLPVGSDHAVAEHTHRGPCDPLKGPIYLCLRTLRRKYIFKEWLSEHDQSMQETEILIDLTNDPLEDTNIANNPAEAETLGYFRALAKDRVAAIKVQASAMHDAGPGGEPADAVRAQA